MNKKKSDSTLISSVVAPLLLVVSFSNCSRNIEEKNETIHSSLPRINYEKSASFVKLSQSDSLKREIAFVAASFHKWHIETMNKENNTTPTGAYIVRGENGKCKLENERYLSELRKLGTISEKFIQSEIQRTSNCADFMSTINWEDYQNADAYEFSKYCPEFDFDYWTKSQEIFYGVIVDKIKENGKKWEVTLALTYDDENKILERINQPVVTVEREGKRWVITKIDWLSKK